MSKTTKKAKKSPITPDNPEAAAKLSDVFLGHAVRETVWIKENKADNRFPEAMRAEARREAWLNASLIAKERGL